jgi:excisionase family DNA binding protein
MADNLLTIKEAALQLGVSPSSVRNLIARGKLASYRPLPRCVRLDPAEVAAYRQSCRTEACAPGRPPVRNGVVIPRASWD